MYWKTLRREETGARNLKESLLEPENKIRHHAHQYTENKTDAIRKVHNVNMSLQRLLIQEK